LQTGIGSCLNNIESSQIALYLGTYFSYDDKQFNLKYLYSNENFGNLGCSDKIPTKYFNEFGIQYGKKLIYSQHIDLVVLGGLSYIYGRRRGQFLKRYNKMNECGYYSEFKGIEYSTIGIPVDIHLNLKYFLMGIGLHLFSNINIENSNFGFLFTFQIGKLYKISPNTK
jgi:hypothetical protein